MTTIIEETLFICVGQAGGNIGQLLENHGCNVLNINSSPQDLATLNAKHKHLIEGGDGCSKDRLKAKQLVKNDFAAIKELIGRYAKSAKIIMVIFSAGGGTGSGAGPALAKMLTRHYPDAIVPMATILPAVSESYMANANAYACFQDILKVDKSGACFVLDNQEFSNKLDINEQFVEYLLSFLAIPDKDKSVISNVDASEVRTALSAHNMALLAVSPTLPALFEDLANGIFAKAETDKQIEYITLSLADTSISEAQIQTDLRKNFGTPKDCFMTYNSRGMNIAMMSGLSYPAGRLKKIEQYLDENKRSAAEQIQLNADMSFLTKKEKSSLPLDADSDDDIWDEFGV